MLMFQIAYALFLLRATSVALSEKWCECLPTKKWLCSEGCDEDDHRVGLTNVLVSSTTGGSQGDVSGEVIAQLRAISGIQYSKAIIEQWKCDGLIHRFNFTCTQIEHISTICEHTSQAFNLRGAIWTNSYPIASGAQSNRGYCTCNIHINAEEFQIEKYDYNLTNGQSLNLTFSNGSTYQDWESPFNIADVRSKSSVLRNVNTNMSLEWANHYLEQELFFIGLEVTNGTVDVTCEKGIGLNTSTLATQTSTTSKQTSAIQTSQTSQPTSVTLTSPTREPTSAIKTSQTNESTSETLTSPTGKSTPATQTTTKAPKTVSTDDISSTSKIVTSLTNSSFTKTPAVGKSQPPEEKIKFPWYIILVAGLIVLIAVIVIIIVIIRKKKQKQKVEPSDDKPASDTVANTRAPASAFAKVFHNQRHNDDAGISYVLRTLSPLNLQQHSLTVCNDNDTGNATKKKKKRKRRKKLIRTEDLDDNDINEDQAEGEKEEHLIGVSKRRKRKKKHREKKMDGNMDGDDK